MERLPLTDLVNHMKGHQTTNRWDVVVSYDEDKINELLQADSTKLEEILQIEPFTKEVDFWIIVAEGTFDLQLKNPRLQFLAGTTQVALVSELTGTYEFPTTGKGKEMIAAGTQLRLIVSLFNCAGQRIESNGGTTFVPDSKNGIVEGATKDYTIQLDPGNGRGNGLCLVFCNMEAKVISTDTTMKNLAAPIETGITEHFADAKEIYYYLRGLSKYTPSYVNKLLEPVAFNFSITPPDNDRRIPGVLTTWISVKGGEGGGQQPSGQNPLNFRPDGQTRCPIPKASSASVIISSHTMANCFFIVCTKPDSSGGTAAHPNLLQLDFKGDDEYKTIQTAAEPTFWLNWAGASTGYSYFYKDIHSPKPNIDLSMDALDYVLTTNVFFPGKEIFKAHSPVANADKSTGLAVPRDLILTGAVAIE
ncbi:hypothetical protein AO1008_10237 [Aspergillus oryzae 100-8]|uniref:Uncharacterized protein n=1 Tax=Aspergillus oryzae (strain 3.042) TaxID=1160506 RepID=I7ZRG8_ASPO3|nr:hypothetical protein Ao3042_09408 [Aspergillus oryzae 3.042]KDE83671.1 hypothetical protein AO1008_10237 [Aspergillus oryzae 100-8]|eukprot:EIT74599.1 hypothetical protein Ao3042_09408 [Aspergillus oryzae 3.042]